MLPDKTVNHQHLSSDGGLATNMTSHNRLIFLQRPRSPADVLPDCGRTSAGFFAVVCWGSSTQAEDTNRQMKKTSAVV